MTGEEVAADESGSNPRWRNRANEVREAEADDEAAPHGRGDVRRTSYTASDPASRVEEQLGEGEAATVGRGRK